MGGGFFCILWWISYLGLFEQDSSVMECVTSPFRSLFRKTFFHLPIVDKENMWSSLRYKTDWLTLGTKTNQLQTLEQTFLFPNHQPSLVASSLAFAFSILLMRAVDLGPMMPPPQWRRICGERKVLVIATVNSLSIAVRCSCGYFAR